MVLQLTISCTWDDRIVSVELDANDPVENLRAILEVDTGVPGSQQALLHNGKELVDGQTLGQQQVQTGDLIMLMRRQAAQPAARASAGAPAAAAGQPNNPMAMNPDGSAINPGLMLQLLNNPQQLRQLPNDLAEIVRAGDVNRLQTMLRERHRRMKEAEEEERRFMALAEADPFNPEVQRRLEEAIKKKNVEENFETALEYNPEAFGTVCMLYVNMEVNRVPLKAFIDSGAQSTIMGRSCAERCGLLRLLDTRFAGTAVGVGSAKILGRVHMVQLQAGGHFFPVSITVLDNDSMEFLFGLDNLKRHQCSIDLKANVLRFTSTGTELPFLAEHEIPKKERLDHMDVEGEGAAASGSAGAGPSGAPSAAAAGGAGLAGDAPAGQPAAAPAAAPVAAGGGLPAGWEDKVQRLQALGFQREQCIAALRQTNGNEEMAGSILFSMFD